MSIDNARQTSHSDQRSRYFRVSTMQPALREVSLRWSDRLSATV